MENDIEEQSQLVPLEIPDNFKLSSGLVNVLRNLFLNGPLGNQLSIQKWIMSPIPQENLFPSK